MGILIAIVVLVAAAFVVVAIGASREGMSKKGWAVSYILVPAMYGRGKYNPVEYRSKIAENHRKGPSVPDAATQGKFRFSEENIAGIRVFRLAPKASDSFNRILYLHGGGYVFDLDIAQLKYVADLVSRTGAEVIVPAYKLAPEGKVEEGLTAVQAVYLKAVGEVGAAHVSITGDSAGGGMTLALAQRVRDAGQPLPASLVLIYPWLDVTMSGTDQPALQKRDPFMLMDELKDSGLMWAGNFSPRKPAVSPLFGNQKGLPPMMVLVGTRDMLLSDARRLAKQVPSAQVVEYPGMFHAFLVAPVPEREDAVNKAANFMKQHWPVRQ